MTKGIIVDHRESRVRYAISEQNFNKKVHKRVRDLKPGETILGYRPHPIARLGEKEELPVHEDNVTNAANLDLESSDEDEEDFDEDDLDDEAEGSSAEDDLGTDK